MAGKNKTKVSKKVKKVITKKATSASRIMKKGKVKTTAPRRSLAKAGKKKIKAVVVKKPKVSKTKVVAVKAGAVVKKISKSSKVLPLLSKLNKAKLKGQTVLLRVDWNVPLVGGRVDNDFRIVQSLKTIEYLVMAEAKVVVISHLGDSKASLEAVARAVTKYIPATFCADNDPKAAVERMNNGDIIILENLRRDPGEEKNSLALAKKLASLADMYVNDAFSVCHRRHASVVGIAKLLPSYAGFLLEAEISSLSQAFKPAKPFLVVLGGAKFSTKIPLIKKILPLADTILIGGALANDFYKAGGLEVGRSLVDTGKSLAKSFIDETKIIVPTTVVVTGFSIGTKPANEVETQEMIVDADPEWLGRLSSMITNAKMILWNGPLGNYENGYSEGTKALAKLIAGSRAYSIVGGGDTIAAIEELGLTNQFSFVSTGGGAMLDFLASGTLPGIEALK